VTAEELKAEIKIEFDSLLQVVNELEALRRDVAGREPTVREKTAAAAFLAQFYSGIENVLKRLSRFHGVTLPGGDTWHLDLFKRFCLPALPPLPSIFDPALERQLGPFRRFRHVVHHGYGFQIDWERMSEGLDQVSAILAAFSRRVARHLDTI
jgi:hypothetical protein